MYLALYIVCLAHICIHNAALYGVRSTRWQAKKRAARRCGSSSYTAQKTIQSCLRAPTESTKKNIAPRRHIGIVCVLRHMRRRLCENMRLCTTRKKKHMYTKRERATWMPSGVRCACHSIATTTTTHVWHARGREWGCAFVCRDVCCRARAASAPNVGCRQPQPRKRHV